MNKIPEARHLLQVGDTDDGSLDVKIICLADGDCGGWQECRENHDGADEGPWDCDESDPWEGKDVFDFHGVEHTWLDGHGWTVPFVGCVVAASDCDFPYGFSDLAPGRYEIDDEWDDTDLTLTLREPIVNVTERATKADS